MQINNNVVITGSSGFLGGYLSRYLGCRFKNIYLFSRTNPNNLSNHILYDINSPLSVEAKEIISNANIIIHCAHNFSHTSNNIEEDANIKATIELHQTNPSAKFIYISSATATKDSISYYSKLKYHIEHLITSDNSLIIKPSLVIGDGGLVNNISKFIKHNKLIPLIKLNPDKLYYVFIEDLCEILLDTIINNRNGILSISNPIPISMEKFYYYLAKQNSKEIKIIKVPYSLVYFIFSFFNALKIPLPITKDNLTGVFNFRFVEHNLQYNFLKNYKSID